MTAFEFGTAPGIKTARWRVNQADWDSWSRELDAVLQNFSQKVDINASSDDIYKEIRKGVLDLANKEIGKCVISKRHKVWWDDELADKLREVKRVKRLFKKRCSVSNREKYLSCKQLFYDMYCQKHQDFLT